MPEHLSPKPEPIPDEIREIVARQLGGFVDKWGAEKPDERMVVAAEIRMDLATAEAPGDDDEAREAYASATRAILANGIVREDELIQLVEGIRADHGL